ncbi:MAG: hypothetical protein LBM19_04540 [Holosporales bacterium]|nr:hypothetical protein [Holosporales bacterium]
MFGFAEPELQSSAAVNTAKAAALKYEILICMFINNFETYNIPELQP